MLQVALVSHFICRDTWSNALAVVVGALNLLVIVTSSRPIENPQPRFLLSANNMRSSSNSACGVPNCVMCFPWPVIIQSAVLSFPRALANQGERQLYLTACIELTFTHFDVQE